MPIKTESQKRAVRLKRDYKKLRPDEQRDFYKSLITHSFREAVERIGLGDSYAKSSLRAIGYQIYKSIDPEKLEIDKDIIKMVQEAVEGRKASGRQQIVEKDPHELEFTPTEIIDPKDNKQVVIAGRNKAAMLLHKKMDRINKNKKLLDNVSLTQLATTFAIMFDKTQIIQGEATENIAVMANINKDMSPEESLDALLKMREAEADKK